MTIGQEKSDGFVVPKSRRKSEAPRERTGKGTTANKQTGGLVSPGDQPQARVRSGVDNKEFRAGPLFLSPLLLSSGEPNEHC